MFNRNCDLAAYIIILLKQERNITL